MRRRTENWSIEKLQRLRDQISFPEYQREKDLWTDSKKSLLIDSILIDIDIPKLYFNARDKNHFEVVDGQQRLWAIWEFLDDMYEHDGKVFSKLGQKEKDAILNYQMQVTLLNDVDDNYVRTLFVRLQLGLLLNTGERLNASTGKMKEFVFNKMTSSKFIVGINIGERRFSKQTLCGQIAINAFSLAKNEKFARTRYDDLSAFFVEYADPRGEDQRIFGEQTAAIIATLDWLWSAFGESGAKKLTNRSYILTVVLYVHGHPLPSAEQATFVKFVSTLWKRLREEAAAGIDRTNRELFTFQSYLSSAPGEEYQIRRRDKTFGEYYVHFEKTGTVSGE